MLASHKERDHHVGNFKVGDRVAIFVRAGHQVPDHVVRVFFDVFLAPRTDDFKVGLGHFALRVISFSIMRKRRPWQHEVDWGEAHIQIVVEISEAGVEFAANFLPCSDLEAV